MDNVIRMPNRSLVSDEAAEWIVRAERGLDEGELSELKKWLAADPLHRQEFLETAALWDDLGMLTELSSIFPLQTPPAAVRPARQTRKKAWAALAAGLATVAVLVGIARWDTPPANDITYAQEFHTAIGELEVRQLPDGSVLTLNTNTRVSVEYTESGRDVVLDQGEAHFEVAHDPAAPFAVHVGGRVVRALGTAFSVQLERSDIEVTVTEGKVSIASPNEAAGRNGDRKRVSARDIAVVSAGEVAVVTDTTQAVARLAPSDLDVKLAWQRGMLIFEGEPLSEVLAEVNRYATTPIVLGDRSLGTIRVGGYFRTKDVDALLASLSENFQIESEVTENQVVLNRRRR